MLTNAIARLVTWRTTEDGIIPLEETAVRRTPGEPVTARNVQSRYGFIIDGLTSPNVQRGRILRALVCTESKGNTDPHPRYEPNYCDYSFGLCQILTGTAARLMADLGIAHPAPLVLRKPDDDHPHVQQWRALLADPHLSLRLAAYYTQTNDVRFGCSNDPVLLYAAYNSGSPRASKTKHDRFGLVSYVRPDHTTALDSFAAWYGDVCCVAAEIAAKPTRTA